MCAECATRTQDTLVGILSTLCHHPCSSYHPTLTLITRPGKSFLNTNLYLSLKFFFISFTAVRQLSLEPLLRERRVLWRSWEAGRTNCRVAFVLPGLSSGSLEINTGPVITTAKTPTEVNADYFHLLVGICMESLCSSRATQPNSTVSACLSAFYSLLDSQWARTLIGKEQVMSTKCFIFLQIWAFKRFVNSDPDCFFLFCAFALGEYCESGVITVVSVFLVLNI